MVMFHDDDFDRDLKQSGIFNSRRKPYTPTPFAHYAGCHHWRQEVRVGRFVISCSGEFHSKGTKGLPKPDFGVYLAKAWEAYLGKGWTNGSYLKRLAVARPYPALVYDWPDGAALSPDELNNLVEICLSKMRKGLRVDIGCLQAHGRTGVLLACLIVRVEHMDGRRALEAARARYCRWAAENRAQEESIEAYARRWSWGRSSK